MAGPKAAVAIKHKEALSYIVAADLDNDDVVSGIIEMERILRDRGAIA